MVYMVTFTINIPPMLAYIPYMDPMGINSYVCLPEGILLAIPKKICCLTIMLY